uniref:EGF-like domain-containing protein n=1 Tax=Eptatretus burgeri TaxID=7764 RepID=A0A8C4QSF4_EPTBU
MKTFRFDIFVNGRVPDITANGEDCMQNFSERSVLMGPGKMFASGPALGSTKSCAKWNHVTTFEQPDAQLPTPPVQTLRVWRNNIEWLSENGYLFITLSATISPDQEYIGGCPHGFHPDNGDLYCADIDECTDEPPPCEHQCLNIHGSFRCSCFTGYHLGGKICPDGCDDETC